MKIGGIKHGGKIEKLKDDNEYMSWIKKGDDFQGGVLNCVPDNEKRMT